MAENPDSSKTEAPTPRRREQARKKGQVAQSSDLSSGLLLLVCGLVLWLGGSVMGKQLVETTQSELLQLGKTEWQLENVPALASRILKRLAQITAPLAACLVLVGFSSGALQNGFNVTTEPLNPDWARLSPAKGWSRIFSTRGLLRGVMTSLKVFAVVLLVGWIVQGQMGLIAGSGFRSLAQAIGQAWSLTIQITMATAAAFVLLGLADYLFQRWRHEEDLKMSRREIKDELKQEEGDPQVRARIKRLQRENAQRRMLKDVAGATVIITNPTHVAVALRYDRDSMAAPKVVAKGAGVVARRIREVAKEHGIPILERKPLARALYAAVEIGQDIPESLYHAIAEILAYIYRLRNAA